MKTTFFLSFFLSLLPLSSDAVICPIGPFNTLFLVDMSL